VLLAGLCCGPAPGGLVSSWPWLVSRLRHVRMRPPSVHWRCNRCTPAGQATGGSTTTALDRNPTPRLPSVVRFPRFDDAPDPHDTAFRS